MANTEKSGLRPDLAVTPRMRVVARNAYQTARSFGMSHERAMKAAQRALQTESMRR